MVKKLTQTSRKSRFEMLEDRRLLTSFNVDAKFVANGSGAGGEAAFGDNATIAQFSSDPGSPTGYYNNNYGTGASTVTDSATSTSPWTFGVLDSGQVNLANSTPYSFSKYVDPNSFDTFPHRCGRCASGRPGYPGERGTESPTGLTALVDSSASATGTAAVFHNFGNDGLNGNGTGSPLPDYIDGYVAIPTGATVLSPAYGPASAKFTAPASGTYVLNLTLTNPYFDPFDGPGGSYGTAAWDWDAGQADYAIYKDPAGSTTLSNTTTLLDSGFWSDIASVNAGENRSTIGSLNNVGQTYTVANGGLTINSGAGGLGPGGQYGSGGTWSLTNVGSIYSAPAGGYDLTGDEYDMSWTVTQTVSLNAGDSVQVVDNPEYYNPYPAGVYTAPIYMSATMSTVAAQPAPPVVSTSGSTGQTYTLGGSAVAVDSGISVTSSDTDITGASETIANYQSGDCAQLHADRRHHHRQQLRWRADSDRQRNARPIHGGLAVGHVLHHQHQPDDPHDRRCRR